MTQTVLKTPRRNNNGFTIVELLIVIVVIAILAAITLVVFNGIQNRAVEASMKSDLNHASKLVESYNAVNGQYPSGLASVNENQGFQASKDNEIFYTSNDGASYCITITHDEKSFHVSNEQSDPQSGACSGHGPSTPAQIIEFNKLTFPAGSTSTSVSPTATLQPTDVLVTLIDEHYAAGDAHVVIDGSKVNPVVTKQAATGENIVDVTVSTGLSPSSTIAVVNDASSVRFSYYILRGVSNPSSLTYEVAGWFGGFVDNGQMLTTPSHSFKSGQVGILVATGMVASRLSYPYDSIPAVSEWTNDNNTQRPFSAHTIANSESTSIIGQARVTGFTTAGIILLIIGS
jgi:prepilin-type N-terminal cleavage/methylation domain-containing protein